MKKLINVYVVRDTTTGLYDAGQGQWVDGVWRTRCTARSKDDADEYDDDDFALTYPGGLPAGLEKVVLYSFEPKR